MDSQGICFSFLHLLSLLLVAPGSHKRPFCIWADEIVNQVILLHQEPCCVLQGWNLLPESEWQAPCMGGVQLWINLGFPKVQTRSEGPSKVCCICCHLQVPLIWQGQEGTAWGQAPLTQAQAPTLAPIPISGGHRAAGAVVAKVGGATGTWGVEEWPPRALWTALWAAVFLSLGS